jgi:GNAT superfamily N-acetyltransferase
VESVRPATPDDRPIVVALVDEFVAEQRPLRGGEIWAAVESPRLGHDAVGAALVGAANGARDHHVLLGCLDQSAVGVVIFRVDVVSTGARLAVIEVLYVHPDARQVGVGSLMLETVVDLARELGCTGVDATVLPGNRHAKNFFEMHGLVARAISVHRSVGEGP